MGRNCKTCKKSIPSSEKTNVCVSCNCHMHFTPECTALKTAAISGIKELGVNVIILCNKCVENIERDNFKRGRALASVSEKLSTLDKLKNMEKRLTDLVDQKVVEAMKTTCEKVEETYAAVVAAEKSTETSKTNASHKVGKGKLNHNISQSLRIQGVREDPSKSKGENLVPTNAEVNGILDTMGVKTSIVELRRLGMFNAERKKPRTLLVTLPNEHEARLTLAKSHEHREMLKQKAVSKLPALSKEDALKENLILKKRRELLDEGVPAEKLKIRNLELFIERQKLEIKTEGAKSDWLCFLNILQLNTRSLIDIDRGMKFSNAVLTSNYNEICLCETWLNENINSKEPLLNDYEIYRKDRELDGDKNFHHGGSLIAVKNSLKSKRPFPTHA